MLARLSIRDIVLIDRLDIDFGSGLATLTGETGAGKSILLDAFALALGARGDTAMVREGAEQGQVIAAFELAKAHPARRLLAETNLPINLVANQTGFRSAAAFATAFRAAIGCTPSEFRKVCVD